MIPVGRSEEVAQAAEDGAPLVALESTIITHGLPWPRNLEVARALEQEVRDAGATPATIAVIGGRVRVGLDADQLEWLAQASDVAKLSSGDLACRMASLGDGATTVAATMACAKLAGIEIFATGGIGGVHRGAEVSFDISADLDELASTPVSVICAGAKAILDLPRTLEALETRRVPVVGWRTDALPAFWSRDSGLPVPNRIDEIDALAQAHLTQLSLGGRGGLLIVNPIPEADEIPAAEINPVIEAALAAAEAEGVRGKEVTPFLLAQALRATEGRSLIANEALARNNARLAGRLACKVTAARRATPVA